jgi:hypothetical protein
VSGDDADEGRASDTERPPAPGGDEAHIDFVTYVLSLSSTCMVQLGEIEGPDGPHEDLEGARQSVEILELLEEKTRGNLTGEEERVLHHVAEDLRHRYLTKSLG